MRSRASVRKPASREQGVHPAILHPVVHGDLDRAVALSVDQEAATGKNIILPDIIKGLEGYPLGLFIFLMTMDPVHDIFYR